MKCYKVFQLKDIYPKRESWLNDNKRRVGWGGMGVRAEGRWQEIETHTASRAIRPKSILFVKSILIIDELSIMEYEIAKHIFSLCLISSLLLRMLTEWSNITFPTLLLALLLFLLYSRAFFSRSRHC
jgi:hypothetical protein